MQLQLTWWEFDELLEHFQRRPDIWHADGDLWIRYSDNEKSEALLAVQTVPYEGSSRFRTGTIIGTPLGVTLEEMSDYLLSLLIGHTSYAERTDAATFLEAELGLAPPQAKQASVILAYLFNIGPLDQKMSKETWRGYELRSPASGQFLGQWPIRQGDRPGGSVRLYTTGHELVRVLLSLNGPWQKNMTGCAVQEFSGHLKPLGRNVESLPNILFNEPLPEPIS
jgi:hypothetical protein